MRVRLILFYLGEKVNETNAPLLELRCHIFSWSRIQAELHLHDNDI